MTRIKPILITLAFVACFSCIDKSENTDDERLADFDRWALKHLNPPDLSGLGKRDSCNVSKLLVNPVHTIVDMHNPIVVVWPYFVKNYYVFDNDLNYTIVKARNDSTYFVDHAILDRWSRGTEEYEKAFKRSGNPEKTHPWQILKKPMRPISLPVKSLAFLFNDPAFKKRSEDDYLTDDYLMAKGKLKKIIQAIYFPYIGDSDGYDYDLFEEHVRLNREFIAAECLPALESLIGNPFDAFVYLIRNKGFLIVNVSVVNATLTITFFPLHDRPLENEIDVAPASHNDCSKLPN